MLPAGWRAPASPDDKHGELSELCRTGCVNRTGVQGGRMNYRPVTVAMAILVVVTTSPATLATAYGVADSLAYAVQDASPSDIPHVETDDEVRPDVPAPQPAGAGTNPPAAARATTP